MGSSSLIDLSTTLRITSATSEGGFIFDAYSATDFKFATISVGKITVGHHTAKGWFTDMVVNNASIVVGTDFTLGLTLKGTTLSVSLNGSTVASRAYNALVTDGGFGLFSRTGMTSFDAVTVRADDPSLLNQSFALTAENADSGNGISPLTESQLYGIATEAVREWLAVAGSGAAVALDQIQFVLQNDLPGDAIAWSTGDGTIFIDANAAGFGWFVDETPSESSEFRNIDGELIAKQSSPAFGRMDLLTAVLHEIGHLLGYEHGDDALMNATLEAGQRKLITEQVAPDLKIDWSPESTGSAFSSGARKPSMQGAGFPEFAMVGLKRKDVGRIFGSGKKRFFDDDLQEESHNEDEWYVEV